MLDSNATETQLVAASQRLKLNEALIPVFRASTSLPEAPIASPSVRPTVTQYHSIGADYEIIAESAALVPNRKGKRGQKTVRAAA